MSEQDMYTNGDGHHQEEDDIGPLVQARLADTTARRAQVSVLNEPEMQNIRQAVHETQKNLEEIKNIDTQLDRLNTVLDRMEQANSQLNTKIQEMLESQRRARSERKASLTERNQEQQQQQTQFDEQIRNLLSNCHRARTKPFQADIDQAVDSLASQNLNGGDHVDR